MTPSKLSLYLINSATLGYLFAAVIYILYFINRSRRTYVLAPIVLGITLFLHGASLADRWLMAGFYRPPWTNLYESLIYFSWGLALICWFVELKYKIRFVGAFATPLIFSALGLAFLVPSKEINPLVPSLQSWWILAHSCLAAFAYSGFIVASVIAFLYLIKVGMESRSLGMASGFVGVCSMLLVGGSDVFLKYKYLMTEMVFSDGKWLKNPIPGSDPIKHFMIQPAHLPGLFWMAAILYLVSILFFVPKKTYYLWGQRVLGLAWLSHLLLIGVFIWTIVSYQSITISSSPYSLTLLILLAAVLGFCLLYFYRGENIALKLPTAKRLEELSYKVTLFAFPFMTLILITGAIWAHEAWGRYWGWDPKETTALVTWLIYAAYLHSRMIPGWTGKRAAVISIIGFFSVIFTYLGTNLVLSGLHSYGSQ